MAPTKPGRGISRYLLRMTAAMALLLSISIAGPPALAHQDHDKKKAQAAQVAQRAAIAGNSKSPASAQPVAQPMTHDMSTMEMEADRSTLPFFERLMQWLGRIHPFLVHFPIAFFPAALFTAIVGRRRPSFSAPVQFLVVAGGLLAPFAAATGLLAGMSTDPDPILAVHRWLGVAIGISLVLTLVMLVLYQDDSAAQQPETTTITQAAAASGHVTP